MFPSTNFNSLNNAVNAISLSDDLGIFKYPMQLIFGRASLCKCTCQTNVRGFKKSELSIP